jgi:hypothetical protein
LCIKIKQIIDNDDNNNNEANLHLTPSPASAKSPAGRGGCGGLQAMWALVSDCDKQQAQSIRRTSAAAAAAGASGAAWMGRWMDGETRAGRGVHHAAAGSLTRAAAAGQAAGRPSRRGLEAAREPGRSAGSDLLGGVGAVLGGFGRATWRVATGGTFATTVGERGISGGWRAEESIAWTLRMRLQHSWGCSERAVHMEPISILYFVFIGLM